MLIQRIALRDALLCEGVVHDYEPAPIEGALITEADVFSLLSETPPIEDGDDE